MKTLYFFLNREYTVGVELRVMRAEARRRVVVTENTKRKKLIETAKKLYLLSENHAATENEAKVASKKLQQLLDKHQIEMHEVLAEAGEKIDYQEARTNLNYGRVKKWQTMLAGAVCRITTTKSYWKGRFDTTVNNTKKVSFGREPVFWGEEGAAEVAAEIYRYWALNIDLMAKKATSEYGDELKNDPDIVEKMRIYDVKYVRYLPFLGSRHPDIWRRSWLVGVVSGINDAIGEQERERNTESETALMVIKDKLQVAYKEHSKGFGKMGHQAGAGNRQAFNAGYETGKGIDLASATRRKVKSGSEVKMLGGK